MTLTSEVILIILFFITSFIGVVTGSNSLITVPAMFQFGIDPKVAVATNMFGLTFMSIGASIPFLRRGTVDFKRTWPLIGLTLVSSTLGALLAVVMSAGSLKLTISAAMIVVALFILFRRNIGVEVPKSVSTTSTILTYVLAFLLGVYGGLYSGGYVTILTTVLVAFFGMSFSEAIASTKVINIFSSLVATAVFMWQGLVDYQLGIMLSVTMFIGAYAGAHYAARMNDVWLRRIFIATVILLAIKTLFDFL
jgi:uncharacterized membrane protein YfcA